MKITVEFIVEIGRENLIIISVKDIMNYEDSIGISFYGNDWDEKHEIVTCIEIPKKIISTYLVSNFEQEKNK